jgi:hypothetical protein
MKSIFKLLILSTLCMLIWLGEVLIRGWVGLLWLNYFHLAWLIIGLILLLLVIRVEGKIKPLRHLFGYPALVFAYMIPIIIICLVLYDRHSGTVWNRMLDHSVILAYSLMTIPFVVFGITSFLCNIIVARMEKVKLSIKHKVIMFFSAYLIPVVCSIVTIIIFSQSYIFSKYNIRPFKEGLELIHWIKSGSYLFAFILYEGYYYLWLKGRFN